MFQRQVFNGPARNAEEANRRHMMGLSAYGAIWDRETGTQLAWVEKGDVISAATKQKVATERDGELYALDGKFLCYLGDLHAGVTGGKDAVALARFKKAVGC